MSLLETVKQSLQPHTLISNMRLNSTLIVVTGCLSMLTVTTCFAVAAYHSKVGISDIITFGTVVVSFTGVGIWGKVAQKKTEVPPSNPQTNV